MLGSDLHTHLLSMVADPNVAFILLIVGFFWPHKALPLKWKIRRKLKPVERKVEQPPVIGPVLKAPVKGTRKSAEKSLEVGKKLRDKAPF